MREILSLNEVLYVVRDFVSDARAIAAAVAKLLDQATPGDRATLHRLGQVARDLSHALAIELDRLPAARLEYSGAANAS
jgi:hypothetical protein